MPIQTSTRISRLFGPMGGIAMYLKAFVVKNFRRLKDVKVDLSDETTVFVGANNSGKTSATQIFQLFLDQGKLFEIYDFSADCWETFKQCELANVDDERQLPVISLDLWFEVDEDNLHRVIHLIPKLQWEGQLVGVRASFEPKDKDVLLANFWNAYELARKSLGVGTDDRPTHGYEPWPRDIHDYLTKRLSFEYHINYYKLDSAGFDQDLMPIGTDRAQVLDDGRKILESILRVDFLDAQRHLADAEVRGRSEDLSRRLSRFYERNLQKQTPDLEALKALAESETRLNEHFASVFAPTIDQLGKLGYPGVANPRIVIKTAVKGETLLGGSANVHYALDRASTEVDSVDLMLPAKYNGLGFKNLIYMVVELLDFHRTWLDTEGPCPPVHLVMIEEPEAHLHAQLQQVFIRQVREIVADVDPSLVTQFVLTTHSSHVLYEDFRFIRYFCRLREEKKYQYTDVKNLSTFYSREEVNTRRFLLQYLKLTHCDLFFADAAILVEGNVERLLLPLLVSKDADRLESCHLSTLELGGSFAHKFRGLIEFLQIPCLIITDLDSTSLSISSDSIEDQGSADTLGERKKKPNRWKACLAETPDARTANPTLKEWIPGIAKVDELLSLPGERKVAGLDKSGPGLVRVAYQTQTLTKWRNEEREYAGRTFEEAFVFQNLEWCLNESNDALGLNIDDHGDGQDLAKVTQSVFEAVRTIDKTQFALALIDADLSWKTPTYIVEGLTWLADQLIDVHMSPSQRSTHYEP